MNVLLCSAAVSLRLDENADGRDLRDGGKQMVGDDLQVAPPLQDQLDHAKWIHQSKRMIGRHDKGADLRYALTVAGQDVEIQRQFVDGRSDKLLQIIRFGDFAVGRIEFVYLKDFFGKFDNASTGLSNEWRMAIRRERGFDAEHGSFIHHANLL
jgi:hypothetical protein